MLATIIVLKFDSISPPNRLYIMNLHLH